MKWRWRAPVHQVVDANAMQRCSDPHLGVAPLAQLELVLLELLLDVVRQQRVQQLLRIGTTE